jgi:hypothetical protein
MLILSFDTINQLLNLHPLAQFHQNLTAKVQQKQQFVVGMAVLVRKDLLDHFCVFGDELGDQALVLDRDQPRDVDLLVD